MIRYYIANSNGERVSVLFDDIEEARQVARAAGAGFRVKWTLSDR